MYINFIDLETMDHKDFMDLVKEYLDKRVEETKVPGFDYTYVTKTGTLLALLDSAAMYIQKQNKKAHELELKIIKLQGIIDFLSDKEMEA